MTQPRDQSLDGLRGFAALVVCVFHFACAYAPGLLPEQAARPHWIADTPLAVFWNGSFAVLVFFVLSGFVVAASADRRRRPLPVLMVSRYLRLAIPVLFSTLFAWVLLETSPGGVARLKALIPHPWLQWTYDGGTPGFAAAVWHGAAGVFLHGTSDFNNALWTMKMELIGSFAIYAIYSLPRRWRWVAMFVFALIALRRMGYAAFLTGMLLYEFRERLPRKAGWPALGVGLVLGSQLTGFGARLGLPQMPSQFALGDPGSVWYVLGASAIVYAVLVTPALKGLFRRSPLQFLGKVSFPLYLLHVPLLYTVFAEGYGRTPLILLFAAFLAVSLLLAAAAEAAVDAPTLRFVRWVQEGGCRLTSRTSRLLSVRRERPAVEARPRG